MGTQKQRFHQLQTAQNQDLVYNPYANNSPRLHSINQVSGHKKGASLNVIGREVNPNEGKLVSSNLRNSRIVSQNEWKTLMNINDFSSLGGGILDMEGQPQIADESQLLHSEAPVNKKIMDVIHSHI